MTILRYPFSALFTDYALGISSTIICLVIVITAGGTSPLGWLFIALTLLSLAYTIRTVLQQQTIISVDEQGISRSLFGSVRRIDWSRLQGLSLRYYPRKRPKKKGMGSVLGRLGRRGFEDSAMAEDRPRSPFADGWLELTLRGSDRQRVTLESALPQFFTLTERAAQAARENGIELDPVSDDNLQALASLSAHLLEELQVGPNSHQSASSQSGSPRSNSHRPNSQASE